MKAIKVLFLVGMVIFLSIGLFLLQVFFTANKSFLSSSAFSKQIDAANTSGRLISYLYENIDDINLNGSNDASEMPGGEENEGGSREAVAQFKDSSHGIIIETWLEKEIPALFKGTFSYFVDDSEKLPSIEIKAIKEVLPELYTGMIVHRTDSNMNADKFEEIASVINVEVEKGIRSGYTREKIIERITAHKTIADLGFPDIVIKSIVDSVIDTASSAGSAEINYSDIYYDAVLDFVNEKLQVVEIKDSIDLNSLTAQIFSDGDNPLEEFRNVMGIFRNNIFIAVLLINILIILIIILTAFSPVSALRWIAPGFIVSGVICVISGFLLSKILVMFVSGMGNSDTALLRDFVITLMENGFKNQIILGAFSALAGFILLAASFFIPVGKTVQDPAVQTIPKNFTLMGTLRAALIIILFGTIFLTGRSSYNTMHSGIDRMTYAVRSTPETLKNIDIAGIFAKETGAAFLNEFDGTIEPASKP